MERILVYPYDRSFDPLLEGSSCLPDREITVLVSPRGWGMKGREILCGRKGYSVGEDYEGALSDCEIVWFRDAEIKTDFESNLLGKLLTAVDRGKKIIWSRSDGEENRRIGQLLKGHGRIWSGREEEEKPLLIQERSLHHILAPVLFVCGMSEDTGKLMTQFRLLKSFREKGYRTSLIASRGEAKYMGVHAVPAYMFEDRQETEKIISLNRFVKNIELEESPDLIIIGIPGGPVEISLKCVCGFGVTAYEIAKAAPPDCVVCNIAAATDDKQFWENMRVSMGSVFGRKIDYFNCIPQMLDLLSSNDAHRAEYIRTDVSFLKEQTACIKDKGVVALYDQEQTDRLAERVIDRLSEDKIAIM